MNANNKIFSFHLRRCSNVSVFFFGLVSSFFLRVFFCGFKGARVLDFFFPFFDCQPSKHVATWLTADLPQSPSPEGHLTPPLTHWCPSIFLPGEATLMRGKTRRQLINAISPRLFDPQNVEPFKMPRISQPTRLLACFPRLQYNAISFPLLHGTKLEVNHK